MPIRLKIFAVKCSAAGNPTPQVTWTLDGFPLPSNGRYVLKNKAHNNLTKAKKDAKEMNSFSLS